MTLRNLILPLFLMAALLVAALPVENLAWAADTAPAGTPSEAKPTTTDKDGQQKPCRDLPEAKGGVLLGTIVPCMVYSIQSGTQKFSAEMVNAFRPLLYAFLTLVIVLFGVRIVQGEPEIHKHGLILLLKITIVLTVLDNIPDYYVPKTYAIMKESQEIVVNAIDSTSFQCEQKLGADGQPGKPYGDENTPRLWSMMDCVTGKLFGFTKGENTNGTSGPNMVLVTSLFGLLAGFFFGGTWSVIIFFAMLGVLFSILMLVVRTTLAFLNGYLTICLMLIISPLLMPLVFMKQTQQYFEGVIKNILGGFLMPLIITAYAIFALMMYDKMLFAQDSIVQQLFQYDQIKTALELPRKVCDRNITGNATELRVAADGSSDGSDQDLKKMFLSPFLQNTIIPGLSGANDLCARTSIPIFNTTEVDALNKGREGFEKIFYQLVNLFVLAYLIHIGMKTVEAMVTQLTGARAASAGFQASMSKEFKIEQAAKDAFTQAQRGYRQADGSDSKGKDFLDRTPVATRAAVSQFFSGIRR